MPAGRSSSAVCPTCGRPLKAPAAGPSRDEQPLVSLEHVRKVYGRGPVSVEALRGIDMTIPPNRLVAILGPSGSGKSTLLNLLGCLDSPTEGRILFEGRDTTRLSESERTHFRAENIGFVFQFFNLLPGLTCLQNVILGGVIGGLRPQNARTRAAGLLETVGLDDKSNTLARDLSGGQMQRVAIARALVNEPRLVLADEPTGNLDHNNAREVIEVLRERATGGRTIVLVTHNEELATSYADEVVTLLDGRIVDTPEHAHPEIGASPTEAGAQVASASIELEIGPLAGPGDLVHAQHLIEQAHERPRSARLERFEQNRATFVVTAARPSELALEVASRLAEGGRSPNVRTEGADRIVLDLG